MAAFIKANGETAEKMEKENFQELMAHHMRVNGRMVSTMERASS